MAAKRSAWRQDSEQREARRRRPRRSRVRRRPAPTRVRAHAHRLAALSLPLLLLFRFTFSLCERSGGRGKISTFVGAPAASPRRHIPGSTTSSSGGVRGACYPCWQAEQHQPVLARTKSRSPYEWASCCWSTARSASFHAASSVTASTSRSARCWWAK